MIKKLLISTVATATLSTAVLADTYAGAGLAIESVSGLDSGFSLVLNGGKTLDDVKIGDGTLAVEGEFSYSIISPSLNYYYSYNTDISYMTLGAYAAYIYDINKEFYIKPRAGLVYISEDPSWGNNGIDLAITFGGGYKFNKQMNIFADLNFGLGTITHLTAGVEYHF